MKFDRPTDNTWDINDEIVMANKVHGDVKNAFQHILDSDTTVQLMKNQYELEMIGGIHTHMNLNGKCLKCKLKFKVVSQLL